MDERCEGSPSGCTPAAMGCSQGRCGCVRLRCGRWLVCCSNAGKERWVGGKGKTCTTAGGKKPKLAIQLQEHKRKRVRLMSVLVASLHWLAGWLPSTQRPCVHMCSCVCVRGRG